ncbi:MAG: hypothetical protein HQ539_00375 [Parcubacteria group bacterium]|nr:hypothetical protein [Parcubacteria group bacterium]
MPYLIEIIKEKKNKKYLEKFLDKPFKEMVKFVADVEKEIIAVGGELHSDIAELLIKNNSNPKNLWGGNFYPLMNNNDWVEYNSLINLKPNQNHFNMDIQDKETIDKINKIIKQFVQNE